jgi:hypothetical protein
MRTAENLMIPRDPLFRRFLFHSLIFAVLLCFGGFLVTGSLIAAAFGVAVAPLFALMFRARIAAKERAGWYDRHDEPKDPGPG